MVLQEEGIPNTYCEVETPTD